MKANQNSYLGFKFCSLENPAFSCRFFVFECQVSLRRRIRTEDFEVWMGRGSLFWVLQISNQILCVCVCVCVLIIIGFYKYKFRMFQTCSRNTTNELAKKNQRTNTWAFYQTHVQQSQTTILTNPNLKKKFPQNPK